LVLEQINKNIQLNRDLNEFKAQVYELNWQEPHKSEINDTTLGQIDLLLASGLFQELFFN
jgi:hypothetical protein